MTQAHRGSIIQPGRMPRSLPPTAILWPLKGDLVNDLGHDPAASGSFTIREESVWGDGAIALERATTNLLYDNGIKNWSLYGIESTSISLAEVEANRRWRVTRTGTAGTGNFRMDVPLTKLVNGQEYTMSLAHQVVKGSSGFQMTDWCDMALSRNVSQKVNGYDRSFAVGSRATYDNVYRFMDFNIPPDTTVEFWDLQLEAANYPTSFVAGGRPSAGFFDIPIDLLNYWNGTVNFWIKTSYALPIGSVNQSSILSTGTNSLRMWKWAGSSTHKIVFDWNSDDLTRNNIDINDDGVGFYDWSMVTMTWSGGSQFVAYINGEAVGSRQAGVGKVFKPFESNVMRVQGDCMMADFVIDAEPWDPLFVRGMYQAKSRAISGRDRSSILV